MKNIIASLIFLSLIICSCEKEGDVPNYVGNWSMEQSIGAGNGSGTMIWVEQGAEGWEEMLTEAELTETIEADYLVVGNKLTLNMPGGVPQVYTRQ